MVFRIRGVRRPHDFIGEHGGLSYEIRGVKDAADQKRKKKDDDIGLRFRHKG